MDDILKLAKDYSKERHLDLLPRCNNNILDKLDYIYDENWENQGVPYPYEILTYLFDSYYVLPERPDLAALFCWQAINHSYYVQQLSDNNVGFCQDTKGIELIKRSRHTTDCLHYCRYSGIWHLPYHLLGTQTRIRNTERGRNICGAL